MNINFLPWRQQRKKRYWIMQTGLLLTFLFFNSLFIGVILKRGHESLAYQKQKNQALKIYISSLTESTHHYQQLKQQQSEMTKIIDQRQKYQKYNPIWIHLLTLLKQSFHETLLIRQIVFKNPHIKIIGTTPNSALPIQRFKMALLQSHLLDHVNWHIKTQPSQNEGNTTTLIFEIQGTLR